MRNAPVLLGDLAALFPPQSGIYVFGLTMQLGWIPLKDDYLARLAIGVIVEFDSPTRPTKVILLGSLRLAIPGNQKLLDIQVDAVGVFDIVRHTLEVDATIRRGSVMGLFKVTGDGGLRSSWGDTPYLMATLGGFHPDFHPEPAVFPKLKRILITVDDDLLPDAVELSASGYLALTSNTIQFGAEFTAAIKAGNWKVRRQDRRRRADQAAVLLRRHAEGRRAREVPRAQPDRSEVQGRPERPLAARAAGRGVRIAACFSMRAGATASSSLIRARSPAP